MECKFARLLFAALLGLLLAQSSAAHSHRRHRRLVPSHAHEHFIAKNAITECKVPPQCRTQVEQALLNQEMVTECEAVDDYYDMLRCLDREIMSRTDVSDLNSRSGRICCLTIDEVSNGCRNACRSALFSPTLSHEKKQKRLDVICNAKHGDGIRGDSGLLNCLATAGEWLPQKHKVMK